MTPTMSTPVDKKTRTGRALSANPSQPLNDSVTDQLAAIPGSLAQRPDRALDAGL